MDSIERSSRLETLRLANDILCQQAPHLVKFEQGIAICEELDRIYLEIEPEDTAPSIKTEALRSRVVDALSECSLLERLELGVELVKELEDIRYAIYPSKEEQVSSSRLTQRKISYSDYMKLREHLGFGTIQAWSHGWNKAKSIGLLDQGGMLSIDQLSEVIGKREQFIAPGVGKATLMVYRAVVAS